MTRLTAKDLNDTAQYAMQGELEYLTRLSRELGGGRSFVMIGAGPGVMALAVMEGQDNSPSEMHIIDNDESRLHYTYKHLEGAEVPLDVVHLHHSDSYEYGLAWMAPIDLLIVDGDHSYIGVTKDIAAWTPHVREGGYVFFHDYLERPGGFNGIDVWEPGPVAKALTGLLIDKWDFIEYVGISAVYRKKKWTGFPQFTLS